MAKQARQRSARETLLSARYYCWTKGDFSSMSLIDTLLIDFHGMSPICRSTSHYYGKTEAERSVLNYLRSASKRNPYAT